MADRVLGVVGLWGKRGGEFYMQSVFGCGVLFSGYERCGSLCAFADGL